VSVTTERHFNGAVKSSQSMLDYR